MPGPANQDPVALECYGRAEGLKSDVVACAELRFARPGAAGPRENEGAAGLADLRGPDQRAVPLQRDCVAESIASAVRRALEAAQDRLTSPLSAVAHEDVRQAAQGAAAARVRRADEGRITEQRERIAKVAAATDERRLQTP